MGVNPMKSHILPMADNGIQKYYTLDEVSEVTGYSVRRLYDFAKDGTLETERWGREYRVSTPALKAFIAARKRAAVPLQQQPGAPGPRATAPGAGGDKNGK